MSEKDTSQSSQPVNSGDSSSRKNDADCWNCVGVTYYSDFLRSQGKKPKCYGFEYVSGKQIKPEVMEHLESLPLLKKDSSIWILGFSQSSFRMHRNGQPPLRRRGFFILNYYDESTDARKEIKSEKIKSAEKPLTPPTPVPIIETRKQNPSTKSNELVDRSAFPMLENMVKFLEAYHKSATRLASSMQSVYMKSTVDLPIRFERSVAKLGLACKKLAKKTISRAYTYIFGEDQDPKD